MSEAKSPEPAAKQTAADKLADPPAGAAAARSADAAGSTPVTADKPAVSPRRQNKAVSRKPRRSG